MRVKLNLNLNSEKKKSSNSLKEVISICVPSFLNRQILLTSCHSKIKPLIIPKVYHEVTKNQEWGDSTV